MKIFTMPQGSDSWLEMRCGIATASEFSSLVTPGFEIRAWSTEMPNTFLATKLAEAWCGPLAGANAFAMEQGKFFEQEALPWYRIEHGPVLKVGFCLMDNGKVGCSPDGLIGEDGGLEIKCPESHTHVKYLLAGKLPKDYEAQVHGSMLVTGRPWWNFFSYCRDLPPLVLRVNRDEEKIETLRTALESFQTRFDAGWARLVEANDGPPAPWRKEPKQ